MSGAETVRRFRQKNKVDAPKQAKWRKPAVAAAIAVSIAAFGSIVVQASDSASVYAVAQQYTSARGTPRLQLPQIFMPAPRSVAPNTLSYAPSNIRETTLPSTGKRALDRSRRGEIAKTIKVNPDPSKAWDSDDGESSNLHTRTSFCVRSCDGFYFPIGNADGGSTAAHELACQRACPGAEAQVFVAPAGEGGMEAAVSRNGQSYAATRTAFQFRTQIDAACTCNPAGKARNYSVLNDFTLRPGDMVMSRDGLKVFRGTETFPYRSAHFGKASETKLSARERRWVDMAEGSANTASSRVTATALEAKIAAQIGKTRSNPAGLRGVETSIALGDGRQMRYVGPHEWRTEQH